MGYTNSGELGPVMNHQFDGGYQPTNHSWNSWWLLIHQECTAPTAKYRKITVDVGRDGSLVFDKFPSLPREAPMVLWCLDVGRLMIGSITNRSPNWRSILYRTPPGLPKTWFHSVSWWRLTFAVPVSCKWYFCWEEFWNLPIFLFFNWICEGNWILQMVKSRLPQYPTSGRHR